MEHPWLHKHSPWFPSLLARLSGSASCSLLLLQTELLTGSLIHIAILEETLVWTIARVSGTRDSWDNGVTKMITHTYRHMDTHTRSPSHTHTHTHTHTHRHTHTDTFVGLIQSHGKLGEAILSFPVGDRFVSLPHLLHSRPVWIPPCHAFIPGSMEDVLYLLLGEGEGEGGREGGRERERGIVCGKIRK